MEQAGNDSVIPLSLRTWSGAHSAAGHGSPRRLPFGGTGRSPEPRNSPSEPKTQPSGIQVSVGSQRSQGRRPPQRRSAVRAAKQPAALVVHIREEDVLQRRLDLLDAQPAQAAVSKKGQVDEWYQQEQQARAFLRSMTKEQQEEYNSRGRPAFRAVGNGPLVVRNPFDPLLVVGGSHNAPNGLVPLDAGHLPRVPQAPPMHGPVPLAPARGGPRGFHREVVRRREILRVRRALRPAFPRRAVVPALLAVGRLRLRPLVLLEPLPAALEAPEFGEPAARVEGVPALDPRHPDDDGPGDDIIGYRDRRLLNTRFDVYDFDHLDFIGFWNPSRVSEKNFVKHFGFHFNERKIRVRLPFSLVAEMKDWWTNRIHDVTWENYQLSVSRCRVLVSELAITAQEQYEANLYAPAIAFISSWDKQQNVSRVVEGAHVDLRLYSWPKLKSALKTKFGRASVAAICVGGILSVVVLARLKSGIFSRASAAAGRVSLSLNGALPTLHLHRVWERCFCLPGLFSGSSVFEGMRPRF